MNQGDNGQRAAFEAWLWSVYKLTATWNDRRNCYDEYPAHLAYNAWQAAITQALQHLAVEYTKELDKVSQRNYELRMENAVLKAESQSRGDNNIRELAQA